MAGGEATWAPLKYVAISWFWLPVAGEDMWEKPYIESLVGIDQTRWTACIGSPFGMCGDRNVGFVLCGGVGCPYR